MLKMASRNIPPVYVLSEIPNLAECLKRVEIAEIRSLKMSGMDGNKTFNDEELENIKSAEVAICDGALLANAYKSMPNLKWAHCTWAGVDPILKSIPDKPPFLLTRHSGEAFSGLMAEYVMCQILNCERSSKLCWKSQESKTWLNAEILTSYRSLDEITVAILGVGSMACGIAKFLKSRGSTVLGFARTSHSKCRNYNLFDKFFTDLDDILPECDYLCNTLPSTNLTLGMLNNSVLKKCVKKPMFINVGRGSIITEKELVLALKNDWLSGAVLDVFEQEPLPKSSALWSMPQVTITPHIAAVSRPDHIAEEFIKNYKQYIKGCEMQNVVNWSSGY